MSCDQTVRRNSEKMKKVRDHLQLISVLETEFPEFSKALHLCLYFFFAVVLLFVNIPHLCQASSFLK